MVKMSDINVDTLDLELAIKFHETYERLAPQFGYETREDTKQFDPTSKNGKLMIAVCHEINRGINQEKIKELESVDMVAFSHSKTIRDNFHEWLLERINQLKSEENMK